MKTTFQKNLTFLWSYSCLLKFLLTVWNSPCLPACNIWLVKEFQGQRSLSGCSPWGHTESDTTEHSCINETLCSNNWHISGILETITWFQTSSWIFMLQWIEWWIVRKIKIVAFDWSISENSIIVDLPSNVQIKGEF